MELRVARTTAVVVMAFGVVACGDEEADSAQSAAAPTKNSPPVISGEPATTVLEGEDYLFQPVASDPDGDPIVFHISGKPGWMEFDTRTGELRGRGKKENVGKHRGIVISVSDGEDETLLDPLDIEVLPASSVDNQPPEISGTPSDTAIVGVFYDFVPNVSDPEGDSLSFQILNRPVWASFDAVIGRLSGTPGVTDIGIHADITIRVSDGIATTDLGPFVIVVNEPPAENRAPVISGVPDPDVLVNELWSFQPQAGDPDGDVLSFEVFNAPAWTGFDAASGELSGTPAINDAGIYGDIVIVASDGQASTALPAFSIEVIAPNQPPTISGIPPSQATVGIGYIFSPIAMDPDGDPLVFSIQNRPPWLSMNSTDGTLSGTPGPANVGQYNGITLTVSDGAATASLPAFSITVEGNNTAPTISGSPSTSVLEGASYSFTPTANDADGDTLSFSIVNQPVWASFDSASGRLSGVPAASHIGDYAGIRIEVSDGSETAALPAFSIEVVDVNFAPTISGTPSGSVMEGDAYSFTPQAGDPDGDSLSFAVTNLPSWAGFSATTGTVSGTPGPGDVGTHPDISITVSDGIATDTLGPFSIVVLAAATGSATLSWTPPTEYTDGSPLIIDHYRIYWGTSSGSYTESVAVGGGLTAYTVDNLLGGATYYFAITALDAQDVESTFSNEASKALP